MTSATRFAAKAGAVENTAAASAASRIKSRRIVLSPPRQHMYPCGSTASLSALVEAELRPVQTEV
jgi:hypothetical protein